MTAFFRHRLTRDDPRRVDVLRDWLIEQTLEEYDSNSAEVVAAIDAGMSGDVLEMERGHWVMMSNAVYLFSIAHKKDIVKRRIFELVGTVTAALKSEPVRVVDDGPDAAPAAKAVQGSLFGE